jgi:preprotein translocase subunit SecE
LPRTPKPTTTGAPILTKASARNFRPGEFIRDVWGELQKVTWPNREETVRLTAIVLGISILVGAVLGIMDFAFSRILGDLVFRS